MKLVRNLTMAALSSVALLGSGQLAHATKYVIKFNGVCDQFEVRVLNSLVSGVSNGTQSNGAGCDNSFVTGTVARVSRK